MNLRRGVAAASAGLVLIFIAGWLVRTPYPPAILASLIVKATPGSFATEMIERFGHNAMRFLIVGVHLGVFGASWYLAKLVGGRPRRALAVAAMAWLASMLLAMAAPQGATWLEPLIYAAAVLVAARVMAGAPLAAAFEPALKAGETPLDALQRSRRKFLFRSVAVAGGLVVGGASLVRFLASRSPIDINIAMADEPFVPPPEDSEFPQIAGISPEITSNRDFYTVDINIIKPSIDHEDWELRIHGLVDRKFTLSYRELQSQFPIVEMAHTLTCISNEVGGDLISTAIWRGVRLKDVLAHAGLSAGVVDVVFRAAEGYSDSIPLAKALEETTLVVFGMNGDALPKEHGFPARIIVPGIYGMKNVKWLTEIEAVDSDYQGYWMVRGWSDIATVKTQSRIDVASERAAGVAWAGDRRVSRVEVSADDGNTWRPAVLKRALSPLTWRLWTADLPRGARRVMVRAVDGDGEVQDSRQTAPHPSGASGYHELEIT